MLRERRRLDKGFKRRNLMRWKPGFDSLYTLLVIVTEIGSELNETHRPKAAIDNDFLFDVLTNLHAKALLASREAEWLMLGGFADGALARWRSIHEANVVASFIVLANDPQKCAEHYIASDKIHSVKAMEQYQLYSKRAGLEPYSNADLEDARSTKKTLQEKYGSLDAKSDYDWAADELGKRQPNLFDLEKKTGLDHWRPRFKWASRHIHGSYRPAGSLLGTTESTQQFLLVGASNSGLVDPASMVALSLVGVTSALLFSRAEIVDNIVFMKIIEKYGNDVEAGFLWAENRTRALIEKYPRTWKFRWIAECFWLRHFGDIRSKTRKFRMQFSGD